MTSSLVLATLAEQMEKDPKRKCFRMIGGVLVERTVEEVAPNLQTNLEGVSLAASLYGPFRIVLTISIDQTCCRYFSYTIQGQGGRIRQIRHRLQYPSGSCMTQVLEGTDTCVTISQCQILYLPIAHRMASVPAQSGTTKSFCNAYTIVFLSHI
jgi:hypothetical protein